MNNIYKYIWILYYLNKNISFGEFWTLEKGLCVIFYTYSIFLFDFILLILWSTKNIKLLLIIIFFNFLHGCILSKELFIDSYTHRQTFYFCMYVRKPNKQFQKNLLLHKVWIYHLYRINKHTNIFTGYIHI